MFDALVGPHAEGNRRSVSVATTASAGFSTPVVVGCQSPRTSISLMVQCSRHAPHQLSEVHLTDRQAHQLGVGPCALPRTVMTHRWLAHSLLNLIRDPVDPD